MSKSSISIVGPQSGRIGPIVGYNREGVQLYRSYNPRRSRPQTAAQMLNRAKFRYITELAGIFTDASYYGFIEVRKRLQTYNSVFIHENRRSVTGETPESVWLDPALIKVSAGSCPNVGFQDYGIDGNVATVSWEARLTQKSTYGGDRVQIVAYNEDKRRIQVFYSSRSAETLQMALSGDSGDKVHLYGFVLGMGTANKNKNSATLYIGNVLL